MMDDSRCAARVTPNERWGAFHAHRCNRKAGFGVYYTWVVKVDTHNLMHFLKLRMAPEAQHEVRVYANAIYEHFFKPALPWTAEAFETLVMSTS